MTLNRRQLFRLVGAGAALSSLGTTAAVAAQPKFVKPTAEKPMLLCFNENPVPLSLSLRAGHRIQKGFG